jgi:hypothetical protein
VCVDSRSALPPPHTTHVESPSPRKTPGGSNLRWNEDDESSPGVPTGAGQLPPLQEEDTEPAAVFSPSGVPKGACGVCQKQVYDTQQRCRSDDGVVSAPLFLSAPSLSSLQDILALLLYLTFLRTRARSRTHVHKLAPIHITIGVNAHVHVHTHTLHIHVSSPTLLYLIMQCLLLRF